MGKHVRFVFDKVIQENLDSEDIVELSERLYSFIDLGLVNCGDHEELYIDHEYLQTLVNSINVINRAIDKYGCDHDGLVKYPFWEV